MKIEQKIELMESISNRWGDHAMTSDAEARAAKQKLKELRLLQEIDLDAKTAPVVNIVQEKIIALFFLQEGLDR